MATDVKIRGQSLDPQPSKIIPHPPEPTRIRMADGRWKSFTPIFGWWFELQYGSEQLTDGDGINDVLSLIEGSGDDGLASLEYTNADGAQIVKYVFIDQEVAPIIRWGDNPETFMIPLYEGGEETGS